MVSPFHEGAMGVGGRRYNGILCQVCESRERAHS